MFGLSRYPLRGYLDDLFEVSERVVQMVSMGRNLSPLWGLISFAKVLHLRRALTSYSHRFFFLNFRSHRNERNKGNATRGLISVISVISAGQLITCLWEIKKLLGLFMKIFFGGLT